MAWAVPGLLLGGRRVARVRPRPWAVWLWVALGSSGRRSRWSAVGVGATAPALGILIPRDGKLLSGASLYTVCRTCLTDAWPNHATWLLARSSIQMGCSLLHVAKTTSIAATKARCG